MGRLLFIILLLVFSCSDQVKNQGNRLANEASPYLLQHANNPVNWYPYSDEAFLKAEKEDKMVIISIGYSACHWCHVMEEESFSDSTIARVMNENFVSIKVDREERPDVDKTYIDAASLITENVGWPLNIIALPDGRAFYAGSYFTKTQWSKILEYFIEEFKNSREKLVDIAQKVSDEVSTINSVPSFSGAEVVKQQQLDSAIAVLGSDIDKKNGGLTGNIKFPMPTIWELLMFYYFTSGNEEALADVQNTLDNMVSGGIYDHLEGGWARYSTDSEWRIPHFEKMLYDNAQLIKLYSNGYKLLGDVRYLKAIDQSINFMNNTMSNGEGGYYSSIDADSEGEEGTYYIWTKDETDKLLGEDAELFNLYFGITRGGNWTDGKNVLNKLVNTFDLARLTGKSADEIETIINRSKDVLLRARRKRTLPLIDTKILTSWNALMISGLLEAYEATGNIEYLSDAKKSLNFIENELFDGKTLYRYYKEERSDIPGFLDDYAFTCSSYLDMYEATLDEAWLYKAQTLIDSTIEKFKDPESSMYNYTSESQNRLSTKIELMDQVIPSSNSVMAENLVRLGNYFPSEKYLSLAETMVLTMKNQSIEYLRYHSKWGSLLIHSVKPPYEVAIVGNDAELFRNEMSRNYLPTVQYCGGKDEGTLELLANKLVEGETIIYVCQNKICRLPVDNSADALEQLKPRSNLIN